MLKRDTRRHAAKAMLKHSGCYSNTLTLHMYAEDIKLYWLRHIRRPTSQVWVRIRLQTQSQDATYGSGDSL
ncbi:hypothetical protein DBY73_014205 [Enterobacter sp. RIT418]|nr:hypothetical protein DBY73_014205 [Enterobacter sp. RIT 418]